MIFFLCLMGAYLAGGIPFGLIVGYRVKGIDIRKQGSGNLGATNVFRVVGKKWGITVLFLDALKGFLACFASGFLLTDPYARLAVGMAAILGHVFPVWLRFKGGKGVATSLGVFLALIPAPAGAAFALWALVFAIFRIISLASMAAACFFPLAIYWFLAGRAESTAYLIISLLLAGFIFYTHRANVSRIIKGEEKRLF